LQSDDRNSDYNVLYVGLCNFLLQHHQQEQLVCEVGIFVLVELGEFCIVPVQQDAWKYVTDTFDVGHCLERKETTTVGDWLCLKSSDGKGTGRIYLKELLFITGYP
jgi:hypothetical protein